MPRTADVEFEKNVFINCPFDEDYRSLLRPLLFVVLHLGFTPKIALERSDSGEVRIHKICGLIRDSKYSIHDLSRLQASKADEFYRPNDVVREVRNWFVETVGLRDVASASSIWVRFNKFMLDFYDERSREGFSDEDLSFMPVPEFIDFIRRWLRKDGTTSA